MDIRLRLVYSIFSFFLSVFFFFLFTLLSYQTIYIVYAFRWLFIFHISDRIYSAVEKIRLVFVWASSFNLNILPFLKKSWAYRQHICINKQIVESAVLSKWPLYLAYHNLYSITLYQHGHFCVTNIYIHNQCGRNSLTN